MLDVVQFYPGVTRLMLLTSNLSGEVWRWIQMPVKMFIEQRQQRNPKLESGTGKKPEL